MLDSRVGSRKEERLMTAFLPTHQVRGSAVISNLNGLTKMVASDHDSISDAGLRDNLLDEATQVL